MQSEDVVLVNLLPWRWNTGTRSPSDMGPKPAHLEFRVALDRTARACVSLESVPSTHIPALHTRDILSVGATGPSPRLVLQQFPDAAPRRVPQWERLNDGHAWITLHDTWAGSWSPDGGRLGKAWYFDKIIQPEVVEAVLAAYVRLTSGDSRPAPPAGFFHREPIVAYRGVSNREFMALKAGGWRLQGATAEAKPMLGPGVYLGSVWKALRFAKYRVAGYNAGEDTDASAASRAYVLRCMFYVPAGVEIDTVRVDVDVAPHMPAPPADTPKSVWFQMLTAKILAPYQQHARGLIVYCPATCLGTRPHDGRPMWLVKNCEWCVRDAELVVPVEWVQVLSASATDKWNPAEDRTGWSYSVL